MKSASLRNLVRLL